MMSFNPEELKQLYIPPSSFHKGQNGKLMVIGGSRLFHGASLWALKVASRIVDMVFYSSVPENNELTQKLKSEFYDFITVSRESIEEYIEESDCVLIGPGMVRTKISNINPDQIGVKYQILNIKEVNELEDEGEQTYWLTKYLLEKYPNKKWVIDAGALQMMEAKWLRQLKGNVIITPHMKEFESLFDNVILEGGRLRRPTDRIPSEDPIASPASGEASLQDDMVEKMAEEYNCVILLKGEVDIVCSPHECVEVRGGNVGMTKGGTGDVLSGLVAALSCKNDLFSAAKAGSYINKKAGDELFKRVGPYFNATDLADEIPKVLFSKSIQNS